MTNPRYAVLRLDTPIMPLARMGRADLTAEDVILACTGLERHKFLFACYAWLGEEKALPELARLSLLEAVKIERIRRAHAQLPFEARKNAIQSMILSALNEHRSSSICKVCNGVQEVVDDHRHIVCERCKGTGREPQSGRKRAETLGKDSRAYARYWKETYEAIYFMFCGWDNDAYENMRARFKVG